MINFIISHSGLKPTLSYPKACGGDLQSSQHASFLLYIPVTIKFESIII